MGPSPSPLRGGQAPGPGRRHVCAGGSVRGTGLECKVCEAQWKPWAVSLGLRLGRHGGLLRPPASRFRATCEQGSRRGDRRAESVRQAKAPGAGSVGTSGLPERPEPQRACARLAVWHGRRRRALSVWGGDSPGEGAQPQGHLGSASLPLGGDGWGAVRRGSTPVRTAVCRWATWRARRRGGVKAGPRSGQAGAPGLYLTHVDGAPRTRPGVCALWKAREGSSTAGRRPRRASCLLASVRERACTHTPRLTRSAGITCR